MEDLYIILVRMCLIQLVEFNAFQDSNYSLGRVSECACPMANGAEHSQGMYTFWQISTFLEDSVAYVHMSFDGGGAFDQ